MSDSVMVSVKYSGGVTFDDCHVACGVTVSRVLDAGLVHLHDLGHVVIEDGGAPVPPPAPVVEDDAPKSAPARKGKGRVQLPPSTEKL